jgi:hypothetical protein
LRTISNALVANVNTAVFGAGFALLYAGVGGFSWPAANVTAGVLLMAIGARPYLARSRKG